MSERLDRIERRLDTIESVLVSLAGWVHGWGLENGRYRFRTPGADPNDVYTGHQYASPFEPIAHLIKQTQD